MCFYLGSSATTSEPEIFKLLIKLFVLKQIPSKSVHRMVQSIAYGKLIKGSKMCTISQVALPTRLAALTNIPTLSLAAA